MSFAKYLVKNNYISAKDHVDYYISIKSLTPSFIEAAQDLGLLNADRLSDLISKSIELNNTEINNIIDKISIAVKNLNDYRAKEGSEMEKDFRNKISEIKELLGNIEKIEKDRISKKRTKLLDEFKRIELEIDNNGSMLSWDGSIIQP